ncbi:MAG: HEAT repeat domain-containing protein [Planctomycetaceae bacterium]|jgi:hypothetical protein|nr:HEAT repeat domain-containing protein [Planctomycetaceae bacterium]
MSYPFRNTFFLLLLLFLTGCAVENEFIAKLPLFEAKTDKIPGLQPPRERVKQIRLKGEKGAKASEQEKEILTAQLMVEYRTCPDMNMRREAVDAMAKIPHPKRDLYMKEVLKDSDALVRLAALEAMGKSFNGSRIELAEILLNSMKHDTDKDVRLTSLRVFGEKFPLKAKNAAVFSGVTTIPETEVRQLAEPVLFELLYDKVPAVRYQTMQTLQKVTGKDYGSDINKWTQYAQSVQGTNDAPKERTWAEKIPRPQLPMLK